MAEDGPYDPLDFYSFAEEGLGRARTELTESGSEAGLELLNRLIARYPDLGALLGLQYRFLWTPLAPHQIGTEAAAELDRVRMDHAMYVARELVGIDPLAGLRWDDTEKEIRAWTWKLLDGKRTPSGRSRKKQRGLYREVVRTLYVGLRDEEPGMSRAEATRRIAPVLRPFFAPSRCQPGSSGALYQMLRTIEQYDLPGNDG